MRFSNVAHGDEPRYLRNGETLYQGVGFDISQLEAPTQVPEARLWRNLVLLATELPREFRQIAADAAAFVAEPSRRFNRARQLESNFLLGKNGGVYQMHLPGLSFLMLPAYLVDRRLSGGGVADHWPPRLHAVNTFFLAAYVLWALVWLPALLPLCLLVPAAGHTLIAGGTTPTRLIVAVVPLAAVPLAEVLARCGARRWFQVAFGVLAVLSLHNALAYNLHHFKPDGLLVDRSFSGWKTNLLFPAASRSPWEVSAANVWLLIAWFVALAALVAAPALAQARARRRGVWLTGTRRRVGAGAGALVGVTVFVLLGTGVSALTGSWGASRYRVPAQTAAWEAAGLLAGIDHCALCLSSRRGPIGTAGTLAVLADHGVHPRLCGGEAVVQLQAGDGRFVGARRSRVRAGADVAGRQERFALLDPNGGCVESGDIVFLRAADGSYLRRYGDSPRVDGRGLSTGPWERFIVTTPRGGVLRGRDSISFRTPRGHYVAACASGVLRAGRARLDRAARFTLTVVE